MRIPTRIAYLMVSMAMYSAMGVLQLANPQERALDEPWNVILVLANDTAWGMLFLLVAIFAAYSLIQLHERMMGWAYSIMAGLAAFRGLGYLSVELLVQEGGTRGIFFGVVWLHVALGLMVTSWSEAQWHRYPEMRTRAGDRQDPPYPPYVDHPTTLREQIANGDHMRDEGAEDGRD